MACWWHWQWWWCWFMENLQHNFSKMVGGGQRPFGIFPKNHPFWRRHTVPKQLHKSCIYFKIYFDDGIDVEVAVDIDHLGGMTSIFLNSVFESFGSWLFVVILIWKRWRRRLFCRHQPRPGKVFVAKSGSSPPGAASHSSINKEKSEQSGNVKDFSAPHKKHPLIYWKLQCQHISCFESSWSRDPQN